MTSYFGAVELVEAGKMEGSFPTLTKSRILHGGKLAVQFSTNYGVNITVRCRGAWSDVVAILGKIGVLDTLTIEGAAFTNCCIDGTPEFKETEGRDIVTGAIQFDYTVKFVRKTV
jgi:hypothetical protein